MWDKDNYQLLCHNCNQKKGSELPDIKTLDPVLVGKFYNAVDRRNRELAINSY